MTLLCFFFELRLFGKEKLSFFWGGGGLIGIRKKGCCVVVVVSMVFVRGAGWIFVGEPEQRSEHSSKGWWIE